MKAKLTIASMFALGMLFCWLALPRPAHTPPRHPLYCDDAHKVPFIPADQCGGLTSCERMFYNSGVAEPCPKE